MKTFSRSAVREKTRVNGTLNKVNNFNHTLKQMPTVQNVDNSVHSNKKIQRDRKLYTKGMKIKCGNGQEGKQIPNDGRRFSFFTDAQLKQEETLRPVFTGFLLCASTASLSSTVWWWQDVIFFTQWKTLLPVKSPTGIQFCHEMAIFCIKVGDAI